MKNKIRISAIFAVFLLALPVFAKDSKVKNPGKNEVILIGKIVVKPTEDMNFIAATRGLSDAEKESKAKYIIPFAPEDPNDVQDDYEDFIDDNPTISFEEGEFFCARYKVNKKTRNLKFEGASKYKFFGSERSFIWVPFDFNVDVPQGIEAMYIGSFYVETSGNDFTITKINHVDEYELAQEALDKVTKKHFDLYRADLKENPKDEENKNK